MRDFDFQKETDKHSQRELIEARQDEMLSILPNHYTDFMGVKIYSQKREPFSRRKNEI